MAAWPDGTLQVQVVVNGLIYDRARSASGTWSTASTLIDSNGSITDVASVGLRNGDLHVEALVGGSVFDRVRKGTTGNWSSTALQVDGNGAIFGTYATATPDGTLHVGTNA
ncbi:hypothetical protein ACIPC1_10255 [Streptomyces sp. NPDC087263]|uniref:hypothetical protein n=1 Tax=Streptomyces sp. NPDC087263 TaxID=3365773 RepID=UPI003814A521